MYYFLNALSFALPIFLLMSNGILIHYQIFLQWLIEFESTAHYFGNKYK